MMSNLLDYDDGDRTRKDEAAPSSPMPEADEGVDSPWQYELLAFEESEDGGGDVTAAAIPASDALDISRISSPPSRLRVLLIEDNPADARLIREYLDSDPHSGCDLRWIGRLGDIGSDPDDHHVDVVLLDLFLPDSMGLGTIEAVLETLPAAAVVVLTGLEDREASAEAVRRGAQDYLVKSWLHTATLVKSIRLAYERKRRDEELARSEREMALISRLMLDATEAADFEGAVARVLDGVCKSIGWAGGEAWIAEDNGTRLIPGPVSTCVDAQLVERLGVRKRRAIGPAEWGIGDVWSIGSPLWIGDLRDAGIPEWVDLAENAGLRSAVLMPVRAGHSPAALLAFYHTEPLSEDRRLTSLLSAATVPLGAVLKRRQTEDLLRRSEAWRTRLLDTASDGVCILDEESRVAYVNRRACELLDRRAEDIRGRPLSDFLVFEGSDGRRRGHGTGGGLHRLAEVRVRSQRTAVDRWLVMSTSPIVDDIGASEGALAMLTDITPLKNSQQIEAILADAGNMFSASLDPTQTAGALASLIVPGVSDWCGIALTDGPGMEIVSIETADPAHLRQVSELVEALVEDPEVINALRQSHLGGEVELDRAFASVGEPSGRASIPPKPHNAGAERIALLPLVTGQRQFGVAIIGGAATQTAGAAWRMELARELTRRAAMAIENAWLYQEVHTALRNRDEVLGVIAHDLRNPLSAISMYAGLLEDLGSGEGREAWIRAIRRSAEHMDRLIQDLIDIARLESGTLRIEKVPTHIPGLLGDIEEMFGAIAKDRGIELEVEAVDGTRLIWADPVRLKQVLSNLVSNSIKYTPSGGTVAISARTDGERIILSVSDTGEGITSDDLPHVFDRFWQSTKAKAGAGLGLAIAKGLTELHGGEISVESDPASGTIFRLDLPYGDSPGEIGPRERTGQRAAAAAVPPRRSPRRRSRPARILIADDHEIFLSSVEELLREGGSCEIVGRARTAEEAVEKARLLRPDLVLMDLDLPVQGGVAAIRQITRQASPPRVLAVTGNSEEDALVSAMDAGARGYVVKSASPADLMKAIDSVLSQGLAVSASGQRLLVEDRRRQLERALDDPFASLPEQERMILALVAARYTSTEIGKRLFLSPKTVDSYRSRLMRSLGLKHRSDLVHLALRSGLLNKDDPL